MRARSLLFAFSIAHASEVFAAEPVTNFRVEYASRTSCQQIEDFSIQLQERSRHLRPARLDEAVLVFRVELFEQAESFFGRLTIREPNGRETVRVVPGASCDEVINALALIAAVLIDPSKPFESGTRPAARVVSKPSLHPRLESKRPTLEEKASDRPLALGFQAGAGFLVQGGVAPSPRPGVSIEASVSSAVRSGFSPLLGLGWARTLTETAITPNGTAHLEWWTVRATFCPARWQARGWIAFRPCGVFDVGRLEGTGDDTQQAASSVATWLAAGAAGRLEVVPIERLLVLLEAGALAPFSRDRFYFDPESPATTAFEVPAVAGLARLAVAGHFE